MSTTLSNPSEALSVDYGDIPEYSWERYSENTYNNINSTIKDNINKINDKGFRCEDTPSATAGTAAASGVSSQPLREISIDLNWKEKVKQARKDYEIWFNRTERIIMQKYNGAEGGEDLHNYMVSPEYAEFKEEQRKRRDDFKNKFGIDL